MVSMKRVVLCFLWVWFSFSMKAGAVASLKDSTSKWVALHLLEYTRDEALEGLEMHIPALAKQGVNLIFLEVDYNFEFVSHPELRQSAHVITKEGAAHFASVCKAHGIRIVPQFQSLGHQSWSNYTWALLSVYPELDLTPGAFPNNEGIYCREWDPMNPKVNEIVFSLIDEIIEAFDADGIHIGMDEVFLFQSEHAKSTKDLDPAFVYAKVVNDFHDYFVKKKGKELFMWADRLIDGTKYKYGEWESSLNGTAPAIDSIPKDVVLCDWHYEPMESYASIPMFLEKGFSVLPCSYNNIEGVKALIKYSYQLDEPGMLGHMFTTWSGVKPDSLRHYKPLQEGLKVIQSGKFYDVSIQSKLVAGEESLSVSLSTNNPEHQIRYTLNGAEPHAQSTLYTQPFKIFKTAEVKAMVFDGNESIGESKNKTLVIHKGIGKEVAVAVAPSSKYTTADGIHTLVNGVQGSASYADGQWVGYEGTNMELVIDLGQVTQVSKLSFNTLNDTPSWIHHADKIEISQSGDGRMYNLSLEKNIPLSKEVIVSTVIPLNITTRYLKLTFFPKTIPSSFQGAGAKAWLFVDEVVVE